MTTRKNAIVPDGWRPTVHSTVQVLASDTLRPDGIGLPGPWRCIERAPDGGWWLQPASVQARWWLARHGQQVGATSGMVNVHALRLAPAWLQLTIDGKATP